MEQDWSGRLPWASVDAQMFVWYLSKKIPLVSHVGLSRLCTGVRWKTPRCSDPPAENMHFHAIFQKIEKIGKWKLENCR